MLFMCSKVWIFFPLMVLSLCANHSHGGNNVEDWADAGKAAKFETLKCTAGTPSGYDVAYDGVLGGTLDQAHISTSSRFWSSLGTTKDQGRDITLFLWILVTSALSVLVVRRKWPQCPRTLEQMATQGILAWLLILPLTVSGLFLVICLETFVDGLTK